MQLADSAGHATMQLLPAFNAVGELIKKKPTAVNPLKRTFGNCLGAEGKSLLVWNLCDLFRFSMKSLPPQLLSRAKRFEVENAAHALKVQQEVNKTFTVR